MTSKATHRKIRHVRLKKSFTLDKPRIVVFRSLKHIYAQLIDDTASKTLVSASDLTLTTGKKKEKAKEVGKKLAEKAVEKGITLCVFDRAGYKYHGRVKELAEGAREGGLKF